MKYSIILPVRNGGAYVKECIHSILAQTLPDFQLQVLDNCSTDGTLDWIRALKDDRIACYPADKPLSIGENWARIAGIPKQEFMTMIGHDDLLLPHYLEEMDRLIRKHPDASLYQTHYDYVDAQGAFIRPCLPMDEMQYAPEFLACHMARTLDSMGTGYMMRSGLYDRLGGMPPHYPNLIFADYELWINLMREGYKAASLRTCFQYRIHQSVSRTTNGMQYGEAFGLYTAFIKKIMHEDAAIREVVSRYGKGMLLYFCESLSHRLLRTPRSERSATVSQFIENCQQYAADLIPGQDFDPLKVFKIKLASQLDQSAVGRSVFKLYRKIMY
ncbi:MAG: glycosyltransferase [Williamsia sp.]|nr:glycosyltransferase [Williamsia sp.]